jgi:hypothetical protein
VFAYNDSRANIFSWLDQPCNFEKECLMTKDKAQEECDRKTEAAQRASDHQSRMAQQESDARVREATRDAYKKK